MKTLLKIALVLSFVAASSAFVSQLQADGPTAPAEKKTESLWMDDYEAAVKKARKERKLLLLNFTGSDWCGWCIKLKKEIFETEEFQAYAKEKLVLVEVDFPHKKEQSDALKKQNRQLAEKHNIQGYPTLVVLNAREKKVGELGYMAGGPKPFIEKLKTFKK